MDEGRRTSHQDAERRDQVKTGPSEGAGGSQPLPFDGAKEGGAGFVVEGDDDGGGGKVCIVALSGTPVWEQEAGTGEDADGSRSGRQRGGVAVVTTWNPAVARQQSHRFLTLFILWILQPPLGSEDVKLWFLLQNRGTPRK